MGELLNQTMPCPKCNGKKEIRINEKQKEDACDQCGGTGIVIDNRLADILSSELESIITDKHQRLRVVSNLLSRIYALYNDRLEQAYQAGVQDFKDEMAEQENG